MNDLKNIPLYIRKIINRRSPHYVRAYAMITNINDNNPPILSVINIRSLHSRFHFPLFPSIELRDVPIPCPLCLHPENGPLSSTNQNLVHRLESISPIRIRLLSSDAADYQNTAPLLCLSSTVRQTRSVGELKGFLRCG